MSVPSRNGVTFSSPHYTLTQDEQLVLKTKTRALTTVENNDVMIELARYVETRLVEDYDFSPISIPPFDGESEEAVTTILASRGWNECAQLIIMCVNQSGSQMGIFSRSLCFEKGLQAGTMLPYVQKALESNCGVLILRPNTNTVTVHNEKTGDVKVAIRGSETPVSHALCVWENVVPLAMENVQRIALFGYGNGASLCHDIYLKSIFSVDGLNCVTCIATIEASHVLEQDDPDDVKLALSKIAVNFEASASAPRGHKLAYRKARLGCTSLSLGLPAGQTEVNNVAVSTTMALDEVYAYISMSSELSPEVLVESYVGQFARRNGFQDPKSAVTTTNPDPLDVPEEAVRAVPEEAAEAPKKGMFAFLFGGSSPSPAKPKSIEDESTLCVEDFDLLKIVGKGAFGKVMLVKKKSGYNANNIYAMKVLKKSDVIDKGQVEHTKAEQAILVSIRHPYIVCLRFSFQNADKLYLVTDYYSGGNLFAHLRKAKQFDEWRAKFYAAELILALDHLHKNAIIYRDLKLENILMDGHGHICLTDFGLSKQDSQSGASTFCGTAEYIAPELLKGETYGIEVDWWSFGILLYEMMNGRTPFYDKNRKMMYNRIMNRTPSFPSSIFSSDAQSCIQGLLTVNKKERLGHAGASDIMQQSFFKAINFVDLYDRKIEAPFKPVGDGMISTDYVPQEYKNMNAARDSSAKAAPVSDPKLAAEMASAFGGFSFSEETSKDM